MVRITIISTADLVRPHMRKRINNPLKEQAVRHLSNSSSEMRVLFGCDEKDGK